MDKGFRWKNCSIGLIGIVLLTLPFFQISALNEYSDKYERPHVQDIKKEDLQAYQENNIKQAIKAEGLNVTLDDNGFINFEGNLSKMEGIEEIYLEDFVDSLSDISMGSEMFNYDLENEDSMKLAIDSENNTYNVRYFKFKDSYFEVHQKMKTFSLKSMNLNLSKEENQEVGREIYEKDHIHLSYQKGDFISSLSTNEGENIYYKNNKTAMVDKDTFNAYHDKYLFMIMGFVLNFFLLCGSLLLLNGSLRSNVYGTKISSLIHLSKKIKREDKKVFRKKINEVINNQSYKKQEDLKVENKKKEHDKILRSHKIENR